MVFVTDSIVMQLYKLQVINNEAMNKIIYVYTEVSL
jgi:hypothetical protein